MRVVSMPCMDIFEQQSDDYKESVLPSNIKARVAIEAGTNFGWGSYACATVTMKGFGASAPAGTLFKKFGFTTENVVATFKKVAAR